MRPAHLATLPQTESGTANVKAAWGETLRIMRFGLSGFLSTMLYAALFVALVSLFKWSGVAASAAAYAAALPVSFMMQKRFVFRSAGSITRELPGFILLQVVCAGIAMAVAHYTRDVYALHPLFSVAAIGVTIAVINYLAMRTAIFKSEEKS